MNTQICKKKQPMTDECSKIGSLMATIHEIKKQFQFVSL